MGEEEEEAEHLNQKTQEQGRKMETEGRLVEKHAERDEADMKEVGIRGS